jgi:chemotaxis protein MotB
MSRRRREEGGSGRVSHERWLISYADFITLLFAFFVVLYASTNIDNKKIQRIAAAIQNAFRTLGVFSGPLPPGTLDGIDAKLAKDPPKPPSGGGVNLEELRVELEKVLGQELIKHEVDMRVEPDGLVVSLREVGFFKSGDTALLPGAKNTLGRIANVLAERGYEMRVEGHTDNVPIRSSRFKSNWELSTARATEVVAFLIDQYNFDPKHISVAGYSEYRPVASNRLEEGRRMNRRVDLVVVSGYLRQSPGGAGPVPVTK